MSEAITNKTFVDALAWQIEVCIKMFEGVHKENITRIKKLQKNWTNLTEKI